MQKPLSTDVPSQEPLFLTTNLKITFFDFFPRSIHSFIPRYFVLTRKRGNRKTGVIEDFLNIFPLKGFASRFPRTSRVCLALRLAGELTRPFLWAGAAAAACIIRCASNSKYKSKFVFFSLSLFIL